MPWLWNLWLERCGHSTTRSKTCGRSPGLARPPRRTRQGARLCPAYLCPTSAGTRTGACRVASENGPTRTPANEGLAPPAGDYLVRAWDLHHLMAPTPTQRRVGACGLDSQAVAGPRQPRRQPGCSWRPVTLAAPAVEPGRMVQSGRPGRRASCGLTTHPGCTPHDTSQAGLGRT